MKTYMFPGQGSQARGMGAELFDRFADLTARADAVVGYSIKELCLTDPRGELNDTRFTQPALYVVNALSYFNKLADDPARPDFLAGHSLGEYNALLAADCFDFETGLKLVRKRGELMSQATRGAMAAIMNASREQIETVLRDNGLDAIDLANYNTPSQIVISGSADEIARAQPLFQQGKMRYYPLNTSGAFHSRCMLPAMREFRSFLQQFNFGPPRIPVIANVSARPYGADEVTENLAQQIASTVRWSESIQFLISRANGTGMQFEEVGHGDVLTKLVFTIKQQTRREADKTVQAAGPVAPVVPTVLPTTVPVPASSTAETARPAPREKVAAWNRSNPVGTRVRSLTGRYPELRTRTEAVLLFGHRAAVYMLGYNGYFDLEEIVPA